MARELERLEALAIRRRLRVRLLRAARGTLGAGATLATLIKLKLAGSLTLKLGIAVLVGLGLACPFVVLAVVVLMGFVLAVVSLFDGGSVDCPDTAWGDGCERREKRAVRLRHLIARREAWLAAPSGPAPSAQRREAAPLSAR
ncbi:hypothetical protein [Methylobacterium sp. Leaf111]|uniref:hypothetical protein n=1 Tax=Methylobacterium sp. Leaf111 TaxID=1736257 RepID=UPI000B19F358|nr:hypothetical protein [Methylobacterium sp. Leaf111]